MNMDLNLTAIVKDNFVHFRRYRVGNFFYGVVYKGEKYEFPVPLEDIGDATLPDSDKAIMFMRYIRKAINDNTFVSIN